MQLRKTISELMIYDADDKLSIDEAREFVQSYQYGAWTVGAEGVRSAAEIGPVLGKYCNIQQVSFCTHGSPGGVFFNGGSLNSGSLKNVKIPANLFNGHGRLLFMGCETARTQAGLNFVLDAGKHFFAGKGGVVGASTIYNLGFSSGTRLPVFGAHSAGFDSGKLVLFHLDANGNLLGTKNVRPFGLDSFLPA